MNVSSGRLHRRSLLLGLLAGLVFVCLALLVLIRWYPYPMNFTAYPRLTKTQSGVDGDPINLVFVGSQEQVTRSFQQAKWLIPDPITPQTSEKIAVASLAHRSYPTAPVSNLYVFGRVQDLAFEKPTSDVQNRGHVRLWKTETHMSGQQVWIGQASYDNGIELSSANHFPTHHIAPPVDWERNSLGADLQATGLVTEETLVAFTTTIFFAHNGGGDYYESDGDILVINYTTVLLPLHQQPLLLGGLKIGFFLVYDALVTVRGVLLVLLVVGVLFSIGYFVFRSVRWNKTKSKT